MCHCGDVGREAEKAVEPWPVWGRVLFWVIVVAVLGASLVAALSSGRLDWASLRIVVAVVVVPGAALLVVALVSRRSASRSATRLDGELDEAAREISAEAARSEPDRTSGASSLSLRAATAAVEEARRALASGDVDGAASSIGDLVDQTSGWDPSSPLAQAVAACRRTATSLARARDRARRTTR